MTFHWTTLLLMFYNVTKSFIDEMGTEIFSLCCCSLWYRLEECLVCWSVYMSGIWNGILLDRFKSRRHVPGWNSPRELPLAKLPCCIVPWTEWTVLRQVPHLTHSARVAFFSKNWHSHRGHVRRAAVPFPVPTMRASWPFGFGEPCFITRLPSISTFSMRDGYSVLYLSCETSCTHTCPGDVCCSSCHCQL